MATINPFAESKTELADTSSVGSGDAIDSSVTNASSVASVKVRPPTEGESPTHNAQGEMVAVGATHVLDTSGGRRSHRSSRRGGKRASKRGGSRASKRGGKRASKRGGKRSSRRGGSRASRR